LALARATARQVLAKGPHALINMPFKKAVLDKVLQYLRYHRDQEPKELITPLPSDNLIECNCSKWDNKFITEVEKDMVFDLIVAASIMDIPSLLFLAIARASIFIQGKSPERLLKEFKVTSDLPAAEEAELSDYFLGQKKKHGVTPDESGLGGVAVLTNCVLQAAHKNGLLSSPEDTESPGPTADSTRSYRLASWRAIVLADWQQLAAAPTDICADRPLMCAAVAASQGRALRYASTELKKDKKLVLQAVKLNRRALKDADESLRSDRAYVKEAVMANPLSLEGATEELRASKDMLLWAASMGKGSALAGATNNLRTDPDTVKECVKYDPAAFSHIGESLKHDRDVALDAAEANGLSLRYMPSAFRADPEIVGAAIRENSQAQAHAHVSALELLKSEMKNGEWLLNLGEDRQKESTAYGAFREEDFGKRQMSLVDGQREAARKERFVTEHCLKVNKTVWFSAVSTMLQGNMGQANYVAANNFLDKLPSYQRQALYAVTLMWGAVGNVGMRWKNFASMDALPAENLMSIDDCRKALRLTLNHNVVSGDEWYAFHAVDDHTRALLLKDTISQKDAQFSRDEDISVPQRNVEETSKEAPAPAAQPRPEAEESPLGGWPLIAQGLPQQAQHPAGQPEEPQQPDILVDPERPLEEGMRVLFQNLQTKSGITGVLLQKYSNERWKVSMDDGTGNAVLKARYLVPLA